MSKLPKLPDGDEGLCPGYCLRADKRTEFVYNKMMMGSLFYCEFCGECDREYHIWEPSEPLLKKLEGMP